MSEAIDQVAARAVILLAIAAFNTVVLPNLSMRTSWPL
jgi:hypothetical protein